MPNKFDPHSDAQVHVIQSNELSKYTGIISNPYLCCRSSRCCAKWLSTDTLIRLSTDDTSDWAVDRQNDCRWTSSTVGFSMYGIPRLTTQVRPMIQINPVRWHIIRITCPCDLFAFASNFYIENWCLLGYALFPYFCPNT